VSKEIVPLATKNGDDLDEARRRISALEEENLDLEVELDEIHDTMAHLEKRCFDLEDELASARNTIAATEGKDSPLWAKLDQARATIAILEADNFNKERDLCACIAQQGSYQSYVSECDTLKTLVLEKEKEATQHGCRIAELENALDRMSNERNIATTVRESVRPVNHSFAQNQDGAAEKGGEEQSPKQNSFLHEQAGSKTNVFKARKRGSIKQMIDRKILSLLYNEGASS
jgi:septal ring factor EnvC (AmiA/AmiB activator)